MSYEEHIILLDLPTEKPALGFEDYARVLHDIILQNEPQYAIGLFGSWGSGKTTLMRGIQRLLENKGVITVEFSAWRYEREEHLIIPLLDNIREALARWADQNYSEKRSLADMARETATQFGKVLTSLLAGFSLKAGLPGAMELSFSANDAISTARELGKPSHPDADTPRSFYHASFNALKQSAERWVKAKNTLPIVVFIDDLDRCLPESALEVLESMKLFFDLKGFVFVVGLDQEIVEGVLDLKFSAQPQAQSSPAGGPKRSLGANYVQKIFQIPFQLPPISVGQLGEFLNVVCSDASVPQQQSGEILNRVSRHLRQVFPAEQLARSGINPRQVKRFINSFTLQMKIKPHLNPDAVLTLLAVQFQPEWARPWLMLRTRKRIFIDALRRFSETGAVESLTSVDLEREDVPQGFMDYVSSDGSELLSIADNLDEYLHSGELQADSASALAAEMFARVGQLKRELLDLSTKWSADAPGATGDLQSIHKGIGIIFESGTWLFRSSDSAERIRREIEKALLSFDKPAGDLRIDEITGSLIPTLNRLQQYLESVVSGRTRMMARA